MKKAIPFLLAVVLTGCGQSEVPQKADLPTVEALASNPERLKELRQQCKLERAHRKATRPSKRWSGRYSEEP